MIVYAALIFHLSSQETIPVSQLFANQDKVMHLVEYAPFGWLSLKTFTPVTPIGFLAGVGFSLVYAASDEMHQSFVPGRDASIFDWMADAVGVLISSYAYYAKSFKLKSKDEPVQSMDV